MSNQKQDNQKPLKPWVKIREEKRKTSLIPKAQRLDMMREELNRSYAEIILPSIDNYGNEKKETITWPENFK